MTETADYPMFRCEVCGKKHRWEPGIVGTTITCACLEPVVVPGEPECEVIEMAPVEAEVVRPVATRGEAAGSAVLGYQRAAVEAERGLDERYSEANPLIVSVWKDLVLPIALIVIGTGVHFAWAWRTGGSPAMAARAVGSGFLINVLVMLVGVIAAANWLGVTFGPVPTAILKLGAIAVGPGGLAIVAGAAIGGVGGVIAGFLLAIGLYFWLFGYLFDLEVEDVWQTVMVVYGLRVFTGILWMAF